MARGREQIVPPPTRPKRNAKGPGRRAGTVAGSGPEISEEDRQRARDRAHRQRREAQKKKTASPNHGWWSWWFDDERSASDGKKEEAKEDQ